MSQDDYYEGQDNGYVEGKSEGYNEGLKEGKRLGAIKELKGIIDFAENKIENPSDTEYYKAMDEVANNSRKRISELQSTDVDLSSVEPKMEAEGKHNE